MPSENLLKLKSLTEEYNREDHTLEENTAFNNEVFALMDETDPKELYPYLLEILGQAYDETPENLDSQTAQECGSNDLEPKLKCAPEIIASTITMVDITSALQQGTLKLGERIDGLSESLQNHVRDVQRIAKIVDATSNPLYPAGPTTLQ